MTLQRIAILGPIGTFKIGNQEFNGVQLEHITAKVAQLPPDTTELQVDVAGMGGNKATGDSIYDFLIALKPRMKIITNQVGDIASIDTKIFLAGDERVALKGINPTTQKPYGFLIHNPWNPHVSGDAAQLAAASASAKKEEDELANLYMTVSGLPSEGIRPLMKAETDFDAEKALAMKFATSTREALNIAAYNMTKPDEKKKDISLGDQVLIALGLKKAEEEAPVAAAPPAELMGKPMTADGKPAPDGVYTVVGGNITALGEIAAAPAAPAAATPAPAAAAPAAAVPVVTPAPVVALKPEEIAANIAKLVKDQVEAEMVAFKSTFKSNGRPPHKDVIIDFSRVKESPVAARNRELAEADVKKRK